MNTTPPVAPPGPPAGTGGPESPSDPGNPGGAGPRVSREEVRDLGRLRRSSYDRKVAGVAGGLARHLDVDPVILRVAFVVLAFFGGAGLLIYGACWLLVPADGRSEATLNLDERSRTVALVVVGGIAVLALLGDTLGGFGFPWPLAIIGVVVLVIVSSRRRSAVGAPTADPTADPTAYPTASPGVPAPGYAGPSAGQYAGAYPGQYVGPPHAGRYPPAAPRPRNPRRRGPILFWFTAALAALGIGGLGIVDLAGAPVADAAYPALALGVIGVMLLVGAFYGRAGGLIALGLVAALATLGATVADEVDAGRLDQTPRSAAQVDDTQELFAGEIVLDLTQVQDLDALDGRTLVLDVTLGRIEVLLPAGVDVAVDATIEGAGETRLFGSDRDRSQSRFLDGGPDAPVLTLDMSVGFGEIQVDTTGRNLP